MIVSVINNKGGAGKTTLAINLSSAFGQKKETLLIDSDPQESVSAFVERRCEKEYPPLFSSVKITGNGLRNEAVRLSKKYSIVTIDTGGMDSVEPRIANIVSDLVIFPILLSLYDLKAFEETIKSFKDAKIYNPKLKGLVVICRVSPNPFLKKKISQLKDFILSIEADDLFLADSIIYEREIYRESSSEGKSVIEYDNNKAKGEIDGLVKEIFEILGE